jgi:hypothetical protein
MLPLIVAILVAAPPHPSTGVDVWGQPSRSAEVAGRPLGATLAVFRSGTRVQLPRARFHGLAMRPLSVVASHTRGKPGQLVLGRTRRAGAVYLVPTTNGWVCVQGPSFETCHRGLLRSGITWSFASTAAGIEVWGIAADGVARVSLGAQTATVRDNVFFLTRRMKLTSTANLPKSFGTLVVTYRDGRPRVRVLIR